MVSMRKSCVQLMGIHHLKNGQSRELPRTLGMRGREDLFLGKILYSLVKYLRILLFYIREKLFNQEKHLVESRHSFKKFIVTRWYLSVTDVPSYILRIIKRWWVKICKHFFRYWKSHYIETRELLSQWKIIDLPN